MLASAIVFGIQALALTDSKFPVWYPYYGTWFVGFAVEAALLVLSILTRSSSSPYDYVAIVIRVLRICSFIVLPALYFGLRNDRKYYNNVDAERQSLLAKKLAPKPSSSEDSALNGSADENGHTNDNGNGHGNNYGSTDTTVKDSDSDSDSDSVAHANETHQAKLDREARNLIKKRLKQDGNWFTYAKGFTVSGPKFEKVPFPY